MTTATATTPENDHTKPPARPYLNLGVLAVLVYVEAGYGFRHIALLLAITTDVVDYRARTARNAFNTPFTQHAARRARQLGLLPED